MPDFYAHQVFGQQVYQALPERIQKLLAPQLDGWKCGLYGPDPLFFYHPLRANPVSEEGHALHSLSPGVILERFCGMENRPYALGYAAGFLCHYSLDAICHPIVNQAAAGHHLRHTMIEGAFDRSLIPKGDRGLPYEAPKEDEIYQAGAIGYVSADGAQFASSVKWFLAVSRFVAKFRRLTPGRRKWQPTVQQLAEAMQEAVPLCAEQVTALVDALESGRALSFLPKTNFQGIHGAQSRRAAVGAEPKGHALV